MESIVVIVGFLGAGKTTLLKRLVNEYLAHQWQPFIILNDYENAQLDSQQFLNSLPADQIQALSGSCICCSGINELRQQVNSIPPRKQGITFIEANGTSDACSLMEFLGVGISERFQPPVQVSVVDVKNWQQRGQYNELEANQIQVSSLVVLSHRDKVSRERIEKVKQEIMIFNPYAVIHEWEDIDFMELTNLKVSPNQAQKMDHLKAHWSSCSVDLPDPISENKLKLVLEAIPKSILRVKGCTRIDNNDFYTYFEKVPNQDETQFRPYHGALISGPKLLMVGPGSDPATMTQLLNESKRDFRPVER